MIEFIGIEIDYDGIKMQEHVVTKIAKLQETINTKKELQTFLGLINQVREFYSKPCYLFITLTKEIKK